MVIRGRHLEEGDSKGDYSDGSVQAWERKARGV